MIAYGPNDRFFRMKQPSFISHLDKSVDKSCTIFDRMSPEAG